MENRQWPYFDPDFKSLIERIHPPRVCVDNDTCEWCTLVKVDSANKHGILLEMVQVLTDLDLVISKSYISSDGGWLMDVFHVTDQLGNKVTDERLIHYIQQSLGERRGGTSVEVKTCLGRLVKAKPAAEHTTLELTGADRPGLLSEISAMLADLNCNVVAIQAWTHNKRVACIMHLTDYPSGVAIADLDRLAHMEEQVANVLRLHGWDDRRGVRAAARSVGFTHTERRLHQMMFADRDYDAYEREAEEEEGIGPTSTQVSIDYCSEKGYSVVSVKSKDRPKLLFDTVCTLTDMEYVVFHAAISSNGPLAIQEYFIRHMDGCTLDTEGERQRVMKCLKAAIERRLSHGLRLEICTSDRLGLLSDITRVLRENGLWVTRAEVATRGERAVGTFYVTDTSGNDVDARAVEAVVKEVAGCSVFEANNLDEKSSRRNPTGGSSSLGEKNRFSLGSLIWAQLERLSNNFGVLKSEGRKDEFKGK